MLILHTNDDGFGAPGLEALVQASKPFGKPLIVAPEEEHSGVGHKVTTREPLRLRQIGEGQYSLDGTPADCARLALRELSGEVSLVLSGINHGGNLGVDTFISGTVAAAREAVILGVPGLAVSQYRLPENEPVDWERACRWASRAIESLLAENPGPSLWNINLPSLPAGAADPDTVRCDLDLSPLSVEFRSHGEDRYSYSGDYHQRPRVSGRDVDVCFGGNIAVTRLMA